MHPEFAPPSLLNPHGHYNTERSVLLKAPDHSGAHSVLHFEHDLLAGLGRERVEEIARVEPDSDLLPRILDLEALLRLAEIWMVGGELQHPRGERELHRLGPLLRQHRDAPQRG